MKMLRVSVFSANAAVRSGMSYSKNFSGMEREPQTGAYFTRKSSTKDAAA